MPRKPRKMLGDVNAPYAVALRDLIDTQSKETIRNWCLDYTYAIRAVAVENEQKTNGIR